ncbi:hypothetical protein CLOM_g18519 [Closterium sp. NIES-68]|nr:hypothetical protein CLOM_g18519 [Closterium sp. NIES-68]
MSLDGSSYMRGVTAPSTSSFTFLPSGQQPQSQQFQHPFYIFGRSPAQQQQLQQYQQQQPKQQQQQQQPGVIFQPPILLNSTQIKTTIPFNGIDFYSWSFEFELLAQSAGLWPFFTGKFTYPVVGTQLEQQSFLHASLEAYTVLVRNLSPKEQLGVR